MAVIDILTPYDAKKKAAHAAKTVKHGVRPNACYRLFFGVFFLKRDFNFINIEWLKAIKQHNLNIDCNTVFNIISVSGFFNRNTQGKSL